MPPSKAIPTRLSLPSAVYLWLVPWLVLLGGCASSLTNPSFPVSVRQAQADLKRMEAAPVRLARPVVVIGGWGDPLGLPPARLARQLRRATGDDRILAVGMGWLMSFEGCRARVIDHVRETFPCDDPAKTTCVDVVGFSMGGLVARDAARTVDDDSDQPTRGRLHIARLFCIASPIRGASAADWFGFGPLAREMRHGSNRVALLAQAAKHADYDAYYYVRLGDPIVGAVNAAPPGQTAWWVGNRWLQRPHLHAYKDPRIVADIARRLRGEPPLTTWPPAPLPGP